MSNFLKSLTAKNFQSHKETVVKFSKGVNYIIGDSGTGKTSLLQRFPKWVFFNAVFSNLIRSGKKEAYGKIEFYDGTAIEKIKATAKNEIKLNGESLKAAGRKTPDEVLNEINLSENVNFNNNGRLLLDIRPGDRARFINSLVNLEVIDKASKNANRDITRITAEKKRKQEEIKTNKKELKQYAWINEAEGKIEVISQMLLEHKKILKKIDKMEELLEDRREITLRIKRMDKKYPPLKLINEAISTVSELKEVKEKIKQTEQLLKTRERTKRTIDLLSQEDKKLEKTLEKLFPDICPLCNQEVNRKLL